MTRQRQRRTNMCIFGKLTYSRLIALSHNHKSELWMYGKQWNGRGYLGCRKQFGDASMVQDFSRFTDFSLWPLRRLREGDAYLRSKCTSFGAELWEKLGSLPPGLAYRNWHEAREAAGLSGDDLALTFEAGYIDGTFGCALGAERAEAMLVSLSGSRDFSASKSYRRKLQGRHRR